MTWNKWLAVEVDEAGEAEVSEDDPPRPAVPGALSDSERSRDEADAVPELAPKRRRLCGKQPRPFAFLERFVGPGLAAAAALARGPGPLRRPAARAARPNERCTGADGRGCSFSTADLGAPALLQPGRGQRRCLFCGDEHLDRLLAQQNGFQVTKTLLAVRAMSAEKFEECLENLRRRRGDALASDFHARVLRATKRREQKAAPKASPAEKWKDLLTTRHRSAGELGPEDAAAWQETVRRDRMRIRRKVFCPGRLRCRYSEANEQEEIALAPPASDAAPNDSGLPSPDVLKRAEMAEKWCKFGSWQMCQTCRSMRPRPFWPGDLKRVAPPTVKKRGLCQRGVKVPQPSDVPQPLRELPREVVAALRPLDIDAGAYEKVAHGYRAHSSMIRFAWAAEDVEDKIAALETRRQRKRARRAFRFLLEDDCKSAYADFVEKHRLFLGARPDAEERRRKLPLRFLEERGLECALWPHLYWDASLCETAVRLSDERRQWARRTGLSSSEEESEKASGSEAEAGGAVESEGDEPGNRGLRKGRQSIRRSFLQKVLGPVAGYSEEYELLHFVYDLVMWSTLGGTKNSAKGIPLRLALKNASFSPEYWRARHLALLDLQRQVGLPFLFRTGQGGPRAAGVDGTGDHPHGPRPQGVRPRLLQRHEPPNAGEKLEGALARRGRRVRRADRRQFRIPIGVPRRKAKDGDAALSRAGDGPLPLA